MRRTITRLAALAAATTILSTAMAFLPLAAARAETQNVTIEMDVVHGFNPKAPDLKTGVTVTWHNADVTDYPVLRGYHILQADDGSFTSPQIPIGGSWSQTFLNPGTISYHCTIHPNLLSGTLLITGKPVSVKQAPKTVKIVEPKASDPQTWTYKPGDVLATLGQEVTWINEGAAVHTVTASDNSFDSKDIAPGKSWTFTSKKPLSLTYVCTYHSWMTGTIRFAAAGTTPPPPPPPSNQHGSGGGYVPPVAQPVHHGAGPTTYGVNIVEPQATVPFSWKFNPSSLGARVGDTVVWKNAGSSPHTVTSSDKSFDSGSIASGGTFTLKLTKIGTLNYVCTYHPWMKGVIAVAAASTVGPVKAPPAASGGASGASGGQSASGSGDTAGADSGSHETFDPKHVSRTRFAVGALALLTLLGVGLAWPTGRELVRRTRGARPLPVMRVGALPAMPVPAEEERPALAVSVPQSADLAPLVIDEAPAPKPRARKPVTSGKR